MGEEWSTIERRPRISRGVIVGIVAIIVAGTVGYASGKRASDHNTATPGGPVVEGVTTLTTTTTTLPPNTTTSSTVLPGAAGPFAGEWYHHGFVMVLGPTGHGLMQFRLYADC